MQQKTNIKEKVQDKTRDKDFELFFMDMYPRLMRGRVKTPNINN